MQYYGPAVIEAIKDTLFDSLCLSLACANVG